ncbi:MAG: pyridoxamine 5'-phosphate oxidase family protein [Dysgonamonadaceae bacterium]|jgi:nitroimidazol reductase NimA-like FMN-containing flavoprotein (pyridoxamine 5'-phosphate oxidase superfamily)|nr:pyridoxamine 5'-phosphate oxidase family protein [Dysgonamonadaceae bacterium]
MKTIVHTEREQIEAVIEACDVCFIGMADTDATPYVLPMNFACLDGTVYFHSAQEGRKIDILERNPNICITFCSVDKLVRQHPDVACSYSMHAISVVAWGKVVYETDLDRKTEILNIFMKRYTGKTFQYASPAIRNVKIWKVRLDKLSCKETGVSSNNPHTF